MCSHQDRLIEAILMSTHNILYQYEKKKSPETTLVTTTSAATGVFQSETQGRVRSSRGKLSIRIRATEVPL